MSMEIRWVFWTSVVLMMLFGAPAVQAETPENLIIIEKSTLQGNQESPNILYVVPWRPLDLAMPEPAPGQMILPDRARPLQRQEFVRLMGYHRAFREQNPLNSGVSSPGP